MGLSRRSSEPLDYPLLYFWHHKVSPEKQKFSAGDHALIFVFSAIGNKRPVSRYAMAKAVETENPRYKCENVLQLELGICHNSLLIG